MRALYGTSPLASLNKTVAAMLAQEEANQRFYSLQPTEQGMNRLLRKIRFHDEPEGIRCRFCRKGLDEHDPESRKCLFDATSFGFTSVSEELQRWAKTLPRPLSPLPPELLGNFHMITDEIVNAFKLPPSILYGDGV